MITATTDEEQQPIPVEPQFRRKERERKNIFDGFQVFVEKCPKFCVLLITIWSTQLDRQRKISSIDRREFEMRAKEARFFFVVLACYWPVLDGLNQHFQAPVHFPLTSNIDKSPQHHKKFLGLCELIPGPLGEKQECYLCDVQTPPPQDARFL